MASISSISGYTNNYSSYNISNNKSATALDNFDLMQKLQMSMFDPFDSSGTTNSSNQSSDNSIGDILTNDFSSQINKALMQLQTKTSQSFDKEVDNVSKAIDSGDLASAKTAFAHLESRTKDLTSTELTQKQKDLANLRSALESGNLQKAKETIGTIKEHSTQAKMYELSNLANKNTTAYLANQSYSQGAQALTSLSSLVSGIA